ncbi:MAG: hypothetical protein M3498_08770 [Deinococcota bacterium]|nr:hypothetical protein [Deinococcota bacterium]
MPTPKPTPTAPAARLRPHPPPHPPRLLLLLIGLAALAPGLAVAGQPSPDAEGAPVTSVLVTSNPPLPFLPADPPRGRIYRLPPDLSSAAVAFSTEGGPVGLESITADPAGNAFVTFFDGPDDSYPGGVMRLESLALGRDGERFELGRDRVMTGAAVGLVEPKGLSVIAELELVLIADNSNARPSLTAMPLGATSHQGGDAAPLFSVTDFGGADGQPWWFDYDPAAGRLFVAMTGGSLLVYDDFPVLRGASGPDRVVVLTAADGSGESVAANLHGVVYVPEGDAVILSDVGPTTTADQPGFDRNGALFVLGNASVAAGPTPVRLHVHGPASTLGNPVYIAFDGLNLYVAEKTKDTVLRFDDILEHMGEIDLAPSAAVTVPAPESVFLVRD